MAYCIILLEQRQDALTVSRALFLRLHWQGRFLFVGEKDGVEIKAGLGTDAALQPGFLRRGLAEDLQRLSGEALVAVGNLQLSHWPGRQDGQGVVWVFGVVQVPVAINIRRPNRDGAQRLQRLGHCRAAQRCVFAACLGGEALHFWDIIHGADAACLQW